MIVKVIKLTAYKNKSVMLIAPTDIMNNFLKFLSTAFTDARDNAKKHKHIKMEKKYEDFTNQLLIRIEENE